MTVGTKYQTFYGNGQPAGIVTITRVTDKSIFVTNANGHEFREGINSVKRYIATGLYKQIF